MEVSLFTFSVSSHSLTHPPLGLTPKSGQELAVRSLGALVWYLTRCVIDHELLSMKLFEIYRPMDVVEDNDPVFKMRNRLRIALDEEF